MAINFDWLTLSRDSGNQNKGVEVMARPHTGRTQRQKTLYIRTTYGSPTATASIVFTQDGKQEFIDFDDSTASVAKDGTNLTLAGKSNSSKITFSLESPSQGESLPLELPSTYLVGGANATNNIDITADPGADNQFTFSITLSIPANPNPDDRSVTIRAVANGNANIADTCTITQTAADPFLSVNPTSINLNAAGTAQTFNITSNTNWGISSTAN